MRILVVHLSDMHLKASGNAVTGRVSQIAAAINSRRGDAARVMLIFSGDIAFSGTSDEYSVALDFITNLTEEVPGDPAIVVVPGNHDCDFNADSLAREMLITSFRQDPTQVDASVIHTCTSIQDNFFAFRDTLAASSLTSDGKLYYEHVIELGEARLVIRCYNTAWVSQRKENPGTLIFPGNALDNMSTAHFAISVFHHPYNWHVPDKHFKRTVERRSDLVLTGHEHEHDRQVSYRPEHLKATTYIEGSALQRSDDADESAFNVMLVDTDEAKYKFYHFEWHTNLYSPTSSDEAWEPLPLEAGKSDIVFNTQGEFKSWLSDPGFPNLVKADRQQRRFQDIFLYPELIEWFTDPSLKRKRQVIKSDDLFDALQKRDEVFIGAPPRAGRTSLAKQLFVDYLDIGLVPVYLDAVTGRLRPGDDLPNALINCVREQYGDATVEPYRQLHLSRRVILVDNIDRAKENTATLKAFLSQLRGLAAHIVVFGDEARGTISDLAPPLETSPGLHRTFHIRPLSTELRERFAQRWFELTSGAETNEEDQTKRLEEIARTFHNIIGRNYVPAFPIFVISILQAVEERANIDMRASTHGYFYELLIRLALAGDTTTADYGIRLAFLTHVAYEMFQQGTNEFLESELRASFDRYQGRHKVGRLTYEPLIDVLVSRNMLVRSADSVRFKYPYLYYYFVANKLRDNITEPEMQKHISQLTTNLLDEQASDILMFLVHLSNDESLLQRLLDAASAIYTEYHPATLNSKADDPNLEVAYEEKPVTEARLERAKAQDRQLEREDGDGGSQPSNETSRIFGSALHAIRLLGQVLRNFPGQLEADWKIKLTKACYELGLRCISFAIDALDKSHDSLIKDIIAQLRQAYPNASEEKINLQAKMFMPFLKVLASFYLLKLVTTSLAAPELEPIFDEAFGQERTAAIKLLDGSLQMYLKNGFPAGLIKRLVRDFKGQQLPLSTLRLFAIEHFDQIHVPIATRKSVCALLGIEYRVLALPPTKT